MKFGAEWEGSLAASRKFGAEVVVTENRFHRLVPKYRLWPSTGFKDWYQSDPKWSQMARLNGVYNVYR